MAHLSIIIVEDISWLKKSHVLSQSYNKLLIDNATNPHAIVTTHVRAIV